jgi:hypothetical protein
LAVLQQQNLVYDSSQGIAWDVLDGRETPAYREGLKFYGAISAEMYPSLPVLKEGLVRFPYSLPDDEALVERLELETTERMSELWLAVLHRTFELGELFVVGLHPERIAHCQDALEAVLAEARRLEPAVWIARLDEMATWWQTRTTAAVEITSVDQGKLGLTVRGPAGTTVLARSVETDVPVTPWGDGYDRVAAKTFTVHAPLRPLIGLSPDASPALASFLRQQGYILETSEEGERFSYYLEQETFTAEHQRQLLSEIEGTDRPLVRLGRWPEGARSALAVTGDIDALTIWDYALRFLGR